MRVLVVDDEKLIRDVIKELRTLNKPETVRINKEEQK